MRRTPADDDLVAEVTDGPLEVRVRDLRQEHHRVKREREVRSVSCRAVLNGAVGSEVDLSGCDRVYHEKISLCLRLIENHPTFSAGGLEPSFLAQHLGLKLDTFDRVHALELPALNVGG